MEPVLNTPTAHQCAHELFDQRPVPGYTHQNQEHLVREIVHIQKRLQHQEHSLQSIQGEVANLSNTVAQIGISLGMQHIQHRLAATYKSTGWQPDFQHGDTSDYLAPQVFGEMPTPHSLHGTHAIAPGYWNHSYCHHTPIPSSCVQGGSTNLSEQNRDGMPQSYGFHNLHRQSVFLSDGSEHSYFTLPADYPTPLMSHSAVVNVAAEAPPSVAAQVACLTPGLFPKANNTADSESTFIGSWHQAMVVQDASNVFKEMPVYDVYEEDVTASQSCVLPTVDIIEAVNDELEVEVYAGKPIICPEKPTDGVYSFANENKYENEIHTVCFNNVSDNAFSEEATYLTFPHTDRSIKLTTENSTQATSTLCVHEAIMYCHDERPEHINCTNGLEPVQLKFEQEDILISGAVSDVVNSKAWAFGSTPSHCINHVELRLLWDPGDTTFHVLFTTADSATKLQCIDVYKPAVVQILAVQFGARRALNFKSAVKRCDAFGLGRTKVNGSALFVLVIPGSAGTTCSLPSFENRAKLQWDPSIAISLYVYIWPDMRAVKTFNWLQNPLLNDLQCQLPVCNFSCVWDPGIELLFVHQQSINENVKTKCLLLSSKEYLRIWEMGTFFTTFLPP